MKKYVKSDISEEKTHTVTIKGCERFFFKHKLEVTEDEYYMLTHANEIPLSNYEWWELYDKLCQIAEQDATKDYVDHDYKWQVYKANGRNVLGDEYK